MNSVLKTSISLLTLAAILAAAPASAQTFYGDRDERTVLVTPDGAFLDSEAGPQELPESARHTLETSAMRNPVALLKGRRGRMFEAALVGRWDVVSRTAIPGSPRVLYHLVRR